MSALTLQLGRVYNRRRAPRPSQVAPKVSKTDMFENLTDRLTGILNKLTSKGRLTEGDIDEDLVRAYCV